MQKLVTYTLSKIVYAGTLQVRRRNMQKFVTYTLSKTGTVLAHCATNTWCECRATGAVRVTCKAGVYARRTCCLAGCCSRSAARRRRRPAWEGRRCCSRCACRRSARAWAPPWSAPEWAPRCWARAWAPPAQYMCTPGLANPVYVHTSFIFKKRAAQTWEDSATQAQSCAHTADIATYACSYT